jgi:hypothetical protein
MVVHHSTTKAQSRPTENGRSSLPAAGRVFGFWYFLAGAKKYKRFYQEKRTYS